jgi:hypothetical protein
VSLRIDQVVEALAGVADVDDPAGPMCLDQADRVDAAGAIRWWDCRQIVTRSGQTRHIAPGYTLVVEPGRLV